MSRVVVIGGGVGGLAVAARLAVKGHHVTLLEQAATTGGKLARYSRDGFVFDTGPSLFTLPAVYRDLFLKTGRALEAEVGLQEVEPAFGYHFADGSEVVVPGVDPARAAIAFGQAFGGSAEADWRAVIARAGRMWQLTREPFLQSPLEGWRTLLPLARSPRDVRTVAPFTSLRSLGRSLVGDARLRMVLDRYATYSGSDPRRAPAVLATIPYVEQTFGVWHLAGGLATLGDALARRCIERGVTIRTGTAAAQILIREGATAGVRTTDGEMIDADVVVCDVDAEQVYTRLLVDPRARAVRKRIASAGPSLSGFVLMLAVRGRTPGIRHHNVWFPSDYDAEFDALFRKGEPVADPAIYACCPDDPQMRPDGHEAWSILVNAPRHSTEPGTGSNGSVDWDAPGRAEAYAERIVDLLAARGTDLRERILWREIRTPADLARDTLSAGGAIYGTSSNGPRAAFERPSNRGPIPGLFLVGGSAHPGGGLPLVALGAEITAGLIGRA